MFGNILGGMALLVSLFAASPTSTNYVLPSYDIGSGGTDASSSSSYKLNAIAGSQSGDNQSSTSYSVRSGENPTQDANVPPAPTLTNPSSYYDRLLLVVNTGNNPTDTKYLIAISNDNFTTTNYVQTDNSIGASYTFTTYRTYASYGSGSGFNILGLSPNTTYKVKVRAIRGNFTESAYGPTTSGVATVGQSLSFGLTTTLTGTPPFTANFSGLVPGTVFAANADVNVALTTNALNGGAVYIQSSNSALFSASQSYSITSATTDLASAAKGYGAQVTSVSQASGGPLTAQSPFNGSADNIGGLTTALQQFLTTTGPITTGASTLRLKAKADSIVPAATDFGDQLTIIAAMNY